MHKIYLHKNLFFNVPEEYRITRNILFPNYVNRLIIDILKLTQQHADTVICIVFLPA